MPNYAKPFGTAGAVAGGAAGAGLGGILGNALGALDYPRQALYNLGSAGLDAIRGQGSWGDVLKAAPGALGAGLAGGLMATGVGAPLGILAGSALGGLAQGVGKATGRGEFDAATPDDLAEAMGAERGGLGGYMVGALTDPLTYAGGAGGAAKGGELGANFGRNVEAQALARGPMYGGLDTLKGLQVPLDSANATGHLQNLLAHPDLERIAGEIMPGSKYLGAGVETMALRRPDGGVTTISRPSQKIDEILQSHGMPPVDFSQAPAPRPNQLNEMVPSARSAQFAGVPDPAGDSGFNLVDPLTVEHLPSVDMQQRSYAGAANDPAAKAAFLQQREGYREGGNALRARLADQGVSFWDYHSGNYAKTPQGRYVLLDPGAARPASPAAEALMAPGPVANAADRPPTWLERAAMKVMGSDKAVQGEIAAGVAPEALAGRGILPGEQGAGNKAARRFLGVNGFGNLDGANMPQWTTGAVQDALAPDFRAQMAAMQLANPTAQGIGEHTGADLMNLLSDVAPGGGAEKAIELAHAGALPDQPAVQRALARNLDMPGTDVGGRPASASAGSRPGLESGTGGPGGASPAMGSNARMGQAQDLVHQLAHMQQELDQAYEIMGSKAPMDEGFRSMQAGYEQMRDQLLQLVGQTTAGDLMKVAKAKMMR